jgi:hypothetical protein
MADSVQEATRLDTGVVEWDAGKREQAGRGRGSSLSGIKSLARGLSPTRAARGTPAAETCSSPPSAQSGSSSSFSGLTGGFSVLSLAKSALVCERGHPAGLYDASNDGPRRQALNVLCGGSFDFNGKALWLEGPLVKRNRDGKATYQFLLLGFELLYLEVVANKQRCEWTIVAPGVRARVPQKCCVFFISSRAPRYHLHKVFPLTTCRARAGDEAADDRCAFSILNPTKSFVCVAPSPEAAATWLEAIERQARAACAAAGAAYDDPHVTYAVKAPVPLWSRARRWPCCVVFC